MHLTIAAQFVGRSYGWQCAFITESVLYNVAIWEIYVMNNLYFELVASNLADCCFITCFYVKTAYILLSDFWPRPFACVKVVAIALLGLKVKVKSQGQRSKCNRYIGGTPSEGNSCVLVACIYFRLLFYNMFYDRRIDDTILATQFVVIITDHVALDVMQSPPSVCLLYLQNRMTIDFDLSRVRMVMTIAHRVLKVKVVRQGQGHGSG